MPQIDAGATVDLSRYSADCVVHLGAGPCEELDDYLDAGVQRIFLIEADPQIAAVLEQRTATLPQVQVLSVAVAAVQGPGLFYRYQIPGLGSLHPATGLMQLFPGLKGLEQIPMETLGVAMLIDSLALDARQDNLLVLEAAGEELPVLEALHETRQLGLFSGIRLCCGLDPLYDGAAPAGEILDWLRQRGFDLRAEDVSQDPDRPWWELERNPLQAQIYALELQVQRREDEVQSLQGEVHLLGSQLTDQRREAETWKEGVAAAQAQHRLEMQRLNSAYEEQTGRLLEREGLYARLADDEAALIERLAQREAEIESLRQENDDQAARVQGCLAMQQTLSLENQDLHGVIAQLETRLEEQQRQTIHWRGEVEALRAEAEETAANARLREAEHGQEVRRLLEIQQGQETALQEQEPQLGALRSELDQGVARLRESLGALESLDLERQGLEVALGDSRGQLIEQQRQTTVWHEEARRLQGELEERQTQIDQLEEEGVRQRVDWESRLEEELARVQALEQAQVDLVGMAEALRAEIAARDAELDALRMQSEQEAARAEDGLRASESLGREAQGLRDTLDGFREEVLEQRRQTTVWHEEASGLQHELEERQAQIDRLAEERIRQEADWESRLQVLSQARERAEVLCAIAEQRAVAQVSQANARAEELERRAKALADEKETREAAEADAEAQLSEQRRHTEYWIGEGKRLQGDLDQLKRELDARAKEMEAERKRGEELELRLTEKDRRQHLLDEELIKAEAQIDLIKDILIREKAF